MKVTHQRYKEICNQITELKSKIDILIANVPLGPNNPGQGYSFEDLKEATDTAEEIDRLEQELIN